VDKKKTMPIHLAIRSENIPIVQLLLTREADMQIRKADGDGNTPLHLATQRSNLLLITYRLGIDSLFSTLYSLLQAMTCSS
jgi:ankyrin repeat protein